MIVYALVGPSGTGKSHRASVVANQLEANVIIDDGLLIEGNAILAGYSAKQQPTRIGAIRAALFMNPEHAQEIKEALSRLCPEKVLILGTSNGMTERISARLDLPKPAKVIKIQDVASEKEIRKAKFLRTRFSKHVIPAPTLEVKKSFPETLVAPLQVFLRKRVGSGKKDWLEQSVVRPTYTKNGRLTIADGALIAIAGHAAGKVNGVSDIGKISVNVEQEGVVIIEIAPTFTFGFQLHDVAEEVQLRIKNTVEELTGLQVKEVNVQIRSLSITKMKKEATS